MIRHARCLQFARTLYIAFTLMLMFAAAGPLIAQEVLRGEVRIDLEPVYAMEEGSPYPLDTATAQRRALEEAALFYSAMIYGWSFDYAIGERARGIDEDLELSPRGRIAFGDPGLFATDAEVRDQHLCLWTDYRLSESQRRRVASWRTGLVRNVQAIGHAPLRGPEDSAEPAESPVWMQIKQAALEDAACAGIRAMLRGSERNRPKAAQGFIALAEFPRYYLDGGQWAVSARFRVEVTEIAGFAVY